MGSKNKSFYTIALAVVACLVLSKCTTPRTDLRMEETALSEEEILSLSYKPSEQRISVEELAKWDKVAWDLILKFPMDSPSRLFAYLYNAQKAFADTSFAITGAYSGNLGPISLHVLRLCFPQYQDEETNSDLFSEELTLLMAKSIDARFNKEKSKMHPVVLPKTTDLWTVEKPYGLKIPSMQTWALTSPGEFRPVPPPSQTDQFWKDQARETKELSEKATESQKKQSLLWDGSLAPREGDWKAIADKYMDENKIPLELRLEVRAKLAAGMFDAFIAVYEAKYVYLVKRPDMIDPTIKTHIPTPQHPSFPAAHSVVSQAASVILSYYFPENQKEWERLAEEAGMSRLWAGIHFPIDHEVGQQLGTEVGKAILFR